MKVGITEIESLIKWAKAKKKRLQDSVYFEYWKGYTKALDDVLLLMRE